MIRRSVQNVHMIGIGGSGMSGLAEILHAEGFRVTGSDVQESKTLRHLRGLGISIVSNHATENVADAQVVIYSSAVPFDNPERAEAIRRNIPAIPRGEMLAELMRMKYGIAIAGSHGKTTTTTMLGSILHASVFDPTVIIGGKLVGAGSGVKAGRSDYLLVESDESDGSFLWLRPVYVLITNIDREHLAHYGTFETLVDAFVQFANSVPFWGSAVICIDDPVVAAAMPRIHRRVVTYGFSSTADVRVEVSQTGPNGTVSSLYQRGQLLGSFILTQPGLHNVLNATGAAALALELGSPFVSVVDGLAAFHGVERRMEVKHAGPVFVLDDYAHHPTEIRATLAAIRSHWGSPLRVVFQPHRYTRTRDSWADFVSAFVDADQLIVTDIYAASENPLPGVSGETLAAAIRQQGHPNVQYIPRGKLDPAKVLTEQKTGVVVTLGAGDITRLSEELSGWLEGKAA